MSDIENKARLKKLIAAARTAMWGKTIPNVDASAEFIADYLIKNCVIAPPVKLGDVLYFLTEEEETDTLTDEFIPAGSVDSFLVRCIYADDWGVFVGDAESLSYRTDDFGKTVFLTREEAEQAVKERESNA